MFGNHFIYRNGIHFDESAPANEGPKNVSEAISAAKEAIGDKKETPEEKVVPKVPKEPKEEEVEEEVDPDALTEEEERHALELFKSLKDPAFRKNFVSMMANKAGVDEVNTPGEQRKAIKTIRDQINESIGEDFPTLAEKLAGVLEAAIKSEVDSRTKDLHEAEESRQVSAKRAEVTAGLEDAISFYEEVTPAVEKEFLKLQKIIPAPATLNRETMNVYSKMLLRQAADNIGFEIKKAGTKVTTTKVNSIDLDKRRERNLADARSRIASSGKSTNTGAESKPDRPLSIGEAIARAKESLAGKDK